MSKNAGRSASAQCRSSRRAVTSRSIYRTIAICWSGRFTVSRALGFLQASGWGPPFDDEPGGRRVEVGVHDQRDVGEEAVAVLALGERPGDGLPGDLGLARPLRLGALDRVDGGAVQREARIAAQVRALAGVGHR